MTTPKWTKADAKRSEKMGWELIQGSACTLVGRYGIGFQSFKSDDEVIEWVINCASGDEWREPMEDCIGDQKTCRKALFLCAKG